MDVGKNHFACKRKEMFRECLCILLSCSGPQLLDSSESVSVETHSA